MSNLGKGMLAGLVATIVLSALMLMKSMMGVMPELDVIKMIAGMMGRPDQPAVGWALHFMIGVLGYGTAMALTDRASPGGSDVGRGTVIGLVGWLVMMLAVMPLAGAGLFGMDLGVMAPIMTLVLHLIFGAVLGGTYSRIGKTRHTFTLAR